MYTVLVFDDERDIVTALKIYLAAEGYNVLEACDGQQVLDIIAVSKIITS